MQLSVKTSQGDTVTLEVESNTAIKKVNTYDKGGSVVFEVEVENKKIPEERPTPCNSSVRIYLKTLKGTTIALDLESLNTIEDIKRKVYEKEAIPVNQQSIICAGKQLFEGGRTLASYSMQDGSILHLVRRFRSCGYGLDGSHQIYINHPQGQLAMKVNLSDDVGKLKAQIENHLGIADRHQTLTLLGKRRTLSDDSLTLGAYGIEQGSQLKLQCYL